MDHPALSSHSVIEALLKTNRPPTDQEKAVIQESIAATHAELEVVRAQISDTMSYIQSLKLQVEQAEVKLRRLREEEAAISDTITDHRRVFSPFRKLPEDVLREICVACVKVNIPTLSYRRTPLPYRLAQISSGMRYVALTTPFIWASMNVCIDPSGYYCPDLFEKRVYSIMANKAREWFERAGGLTLTVFIEDPSPVYRSLEDIPVSTRLEDIESDPSNIFFDALFSYSTRWSKIQFNSSSSVRSRATIRIAALTAADVPLLQSITLRIKRGSSMFRNSTLLTIPTLSQLTLEVKRENVPNFIVDWSILTTLTLRGSLYRHCSSRGDIGRILQQTKCLRVCDISLGPGLENYPGKITLPFLEILSINEIEFGPASTSSMLDTLTAPILAIFHIRGTFLKLSLLNFVKQSPDIRELSLPFLNDDAEYMTELLRHCPSLSLLSICDEQSNKKHQPSDANGLLRAFVEEGDAGVICPRLQDFNFSAKVNFSLQTLCIFLEGKQHRNATILFPWKRLVVDLRWIDDPEIYKQMQHFLSLKNEEGLDVYVVPMYI